MCKMKRFVAFLLSFGFVMSALVGCNSSSSQSSETTEKTVNDDTTFILSEEEAPYNGSIILDTTISENQYHQVLGGTITDSSLWVVVCEEDRKNDVYESSLYVEEFSQNGEQLNVYPLDFPEIGYVCDICERGDSLIIASCSYNVFNVVSFNLTTHESTPIQLQSGSDMGMTYCNVIALNDQEVYVSMQNSLGAYSCRGYNLSDGSLKMELATTCPTEHFFWEGEQLYTLGQVIGRNEYELLKVNEENQLEQSGKIQLPPYIGRMYNVGNKQYMLADTGIWYLVQTTHTWKEMVNWNRADASQFLKSEYAVSQDGQSFMVWDKDNKNVGFLFPKTDPKEGKVTLTVMGNWITESEKYQWVVSEFNKQNEKYAIELLDYEDVLSPDDYLDDEGWVDYDAYWEAFDDFIWKLLVNGEGPDIFIGSSDWKYFEYGGLFADMKPMYDRMEEEWKNQYISNLFASLETNGHLYAVPLSLALNSTFIRKDCNINIDATYNEWETYLDDNADGKVLFWETGTDFLREVLGYDLNSFVCEENSTTNFDSNEFKSLLHLAKKHCLTQQEYDNNSSRESILISTGYNSEEIHAIVATNEEYYYDYLPYGCISASGASLCFGSSLAYVSSSCKDMEGAWEFICFLLSPEVQEYDLNHAEYSLGDFPVRWDSMEKLFEFLKHPEEHEAFWASKNETSEEWSIEDVTPLTDEECDAFVELVESTHLVYYPDTEIIDIVMEETAPYFSGQKSEDEVIDVINNRVQTLLDERST